MHLKKHSKIPVSLWGKCYGANKSTCELLLKNRYADYVQIITMTSGLSDFTAHIANIRWLRARALFGGVTRG